MQKRRRALLFSSLALSEIFLLVSMIVAVAFIFSQVGEASAFLPYPKSTAPIPKQTGGIFPKLGPDGKIIGSGGSGGSGTSSGGLGIKEGIGKLASGKATFGFSGTTGAVAGALAQGLFWGALLYGAAKLLLPLFGAKEETTNAVANALLAGGVGGGALKALSLGTGRGFLGLNAGQIGFFGGTIIAVAVFLATYTKQSKKLVQFSCLPWEPQLGGAKCEECNKDTFKPCSEYRCKSLGQACQLLNPGTSNEQCAWVIKFDVASPKITPWTEPLRPVDAKYVPDTSVRPPALGVKIVGDGANGCLPAFTPLQFGFTTDEPAQCKIDYNHTQKFEDMQYYTGGSNYYEYNHTQMMRLPGPSGNDTDLKPLLRNDGSFALYTRCRDANGNVNVDEYSFSFCVEEGPDTTPPRIERTSIVSGSPVQYNIDQVPIEVYTNEPADCKWSTQSKAFDDMEHIMNCASDASQVNAELLYTCAGNVTSVKDREDNVFYFRCKDQPGKEDNERNKMVQSYELVLKGSQPLTIDSVLPNSTITGSTSSVNLNLEVQTSNGAEEGKAICYFSPTGAENSYIDMFKTNNFNHEQTLILINGTYTYYIRCVDAGGNAAEKITTFSVAVDTEPPHVTRVYRDQALKIVTDEDAECRYSLNSCNFNLREGLRLENPSTDSLRVHFIDWKTGIAYYVKCSDAYGNEPEPNTCSVIARPTELQKTS